VLALALVALGVFLGGVAYLGWAGGPVGGGALTALRFVLGVIGYAIPVGLILAGVLVLLRELRPPVRPVRTGAICLLAALTLALAAGTLGVGPGVAPAALQWHPAAMEARGGLIGQLEFWLAAHLLSHLGADILAVFLFVAGVILLTGAGVAGMLRATGAGVARTGQAIRRSTGELSALTSARRPGRGPSRDAAASRRGAAGEGRGEDEWGERDPGGGGWSERDRSEGEGAGDPRGEGRGAGAHGEGGPAAGVHGEGVDGEGVHGEGVDGDGEGRGEGGLGEVVVRATHVEAPPIVGVGAREPPEGEAPSDGGPGPAPSGRAARPAADGELTPQGRYRSSVTDNPNFQWRVPSPRFLVRSTGEAARPDTAGQEQVARTLVETLGHFGISASVIGRVTGPHITRYELRLAPGTKVAKVAQLKDDLAYALAATEIRILAPIPGKQAVGVEVPNARRRIVHLGDVFQPPPADWSPLTVWLGKDIAGRAIGADLAKMPHLLVAGTTGAGKSACVNAMLASILLRATPHEVRLVLVDPKQVELNHYESIPHLLTPVITSPRMAANALQNLVREMEQRYGIMSLARTRSLPELNRVRERRGEPALPYILCVIDELADLMMVAPADVEDSIIRLAQKARAVGIHLVLATQSPRVDVITGMIKANVPSRIAFAVSSQTDSRVILDQNGAESLLGQGDMLFSPVGASRLQRIQGAYIDEAQIAELTDAWRRQGEPEFHEELLEEVEGEEEETTGEGEFPPDEDPLLEEAILLVAQMGTASTSMLQRRLRVGYTRAGRLIDMLERRGIISGYEGSKPRQVLIGEGDVPRILAHLAEAEGSAPPPLVSVPDEPASE